MKQDNANSFWQVVKRGFLNKCPNCGNGSLFSSYLKQINKCKFCGENFGHIRAEDGPAWLTILIVGHILAPFLLTYLPEITWPDWIIMSVIISITLSLIYMILPRAKGFFIVMIWRSGCSGSDT